MIMDSKTTKLVDLMGRLTNSIQKENELLEKIGSEAELDQIIKEKKALTIAFEQQIKSIGDISLLNNANPQINGQLKDIFERFQRLAENNAARLLAKIEATKRVFSILQTAVQEQGNPTKTYGNSGNLDQSNKQSYAPALSVGVINEI